jgi:hypothetical protein
MIGQESITPGEFKAWLAGMIEGNKSNKQVTITDLQIIYDMAIKIYEKKDSTTWPQPIIPICPQPPSVGDPMPGPLKVWYSTNDSTAL